MEDIAIDAAARRELIELMESRAHVYDLLSRCFEAEIDEKFACEVANGLDIDTDDGVLATYFNEMQSKLSGVTEEGIEQLAVAFNRVFFGMGPLNAKKAFPYESVYTSERGLMMQDAYVEVRRLYAENGLTKSERFAEPEDHLAMELAFMAHLSRGSAEDLRTGNDGSATDSAELQLSFVEGHLLKWLDRFAADMRIAEKDGFYRSLACATERYVSKDAEFLREVLG